MIYTDALGERSALATTAVAGEKHGVVYTKPWVVQLMLDLSGYTSDADLGVLLAVEPAAGDGRFLLPMVQQLIDSARKHHRDLSTLGTSLLSYELDDLNAAMMREQVERFLVAERVPQALAKMLSTNWVHSGDYLLTASNPPAADMVIGNPPYIRLEEMDADTAKAYRKRYATMVGRADLYVAFFEAALKQLKPDGICSFICADRWMLNQYGAELRRLVTSAYAVETVIELHRADVFEDDVSAYPAITVMRRGPQSTAVVARGESGIEELGSKRIQSVLHRARSSSTGVTGEAALRAGPVQPWFNGTEPWPCYSPERLALLRRLEADFYPLESAGTGTRVSIGVATGADDILITTDTQLVEADRLLPLAMACDTASGQLDWSGHYLVNPWNEYGLVDLSNYPRLREYLFRHQEQLCARHIGKKNAAFWYRTIDRVDPRLTTKHKLYIPDIKDRLNPVLDRGETYPHHNLYYIQSAVWDLEVLGGLLLSDVAQLFVECYGVRMRGGYLRFQAQYLRRIRVPLPHALELTEADGLRQAFRARDRALATAVALRLYGIDEIPGDNA